MYINKHVLNMRAIHVNTCLGLKRLNNLIVLPDLTVSLKPRSSEIQTCELVKNVSEISAHVRLWSNLIKFRILYIYFIYIRTIHRVKLFINNRFPHTYERGYPFRIDIFFGQTSNSETFVPSAKEIWSYCFTW